MATVAELEARLEVRRAQRDSAVARVSYEGRSVEYRGTAEINAAIADLERELQALEGKAAVRQIRLYTSMRPMPMAYFYGLQAMAARAMFEGRRPPNGHALELASPYDVWTGSTSGRHQ
jgi:hypothetical protein